LPAWAAATDLTRSLAEKALIKFSAKPATTERRFWSGEVEGTAKIREVAQVHSLDGHGPLNLPRETTLSRGSVLSPMIKTFVSPGAATEAAACRKASSWRPSS